MDTWDKEQTKMLLSLLKECPCLYNPNDPHFTNQLERNEKYNFILNEMKDFRLNVTVQCIKNKIRTLQSQLSKERTKALKSKQNGTVYKSKLWCYKDLLFLLNCNDTSLCTSTIKLPTFEINKPIEIADEEDDVSPIEQKTKLTEQLRKEAIDALCVVKNLVQQQQKPESIGKEEEFCRYLCSELKKITLDDTFDDLKMDILQLVRKTIKEEKNSLLEQQHCTYNMGAVKGWHLPPSR